MVLKDKKIPATSASDEVDHDEVGLAFGLSPVDLPEGDDQDNRSGLGWMLVILAVSSVLLAAFNSFAIDKWARQLETSATTGPIKDAAARWHATMQGFGLDIPLETGRKLWRASKEATFSETDESGSDEIPPEAP